MKASSVSAYLQLARWPNALMAAAGVLIGAQLLWADVRPERIDPPRLAAAMASAILLTITANAWNDAADVDIDRVAHPERPIPLGLITTGRARRIALVAAVLGVGFAETIAPRLGLITVLVVLLMLAYSPWLKRTGLIGNVTAAFLASLPFLYGAWSSGAPNFVLVGWAFPLHLAREIAKDVDDAAGDRDRRRTVPLSWGRTPARLLVIGALLWFLARIPALNLRPELNWALLPSVGLLVVGGVRVLRGAPGAPRALKGAMLLAMAGLLIAMAVVRSRPLFS